MDAALREEVMAVLQDANDMTIATIRRDGYPHATTVSYANEGLRIYFGCARDSQKAQNLAYNNKISLTINLPYKDWSEIRGLSLGGKAERIEDPDEMERVGQILLQKFPEGVAEYASEGLKDVAIFQIMPEVISLLDYRRGFGHTQLISPVDSLE